MIESGKYKESINEKIAILKREIDQSGFLGLTNIHKHCENFVKDLLNIVYDYKLENLNKEVVTFPGLDLGDKENKLAFQVTSEKTSDKVNDTLTKVIRHKHYLIFSKIKLFVLNEKQGTYTIMNTEPHFSFDWKTDVTDFDDLLKDIQHLSLNKLKSVYDYLEAELPYTINILQNKTAFNVNTKLIDIQNSLAISGMQYYEHWGFTLTLHGGSYSTATIYRNLKEFAITQLFGQYVYVFNEVYRPKISAKEIEYRQPPTQAGAINHYIEAVLLIKDNRIRYEWAQYKDQPLLLTNMHSEMGTLLPLIFFCKKLYKDAPLQLEIDIDLRSNGELSYYSNSMIYRVQHAMNNFKLHPPEVSFSRMLHNIDNKHLIELMQELIHGFVATDRQFGLDEPFIHVNEAEQDEILNKYKEHYGVAEKKEA